MRRINNIAKTRATENNLDIYKRLILPVRLYCEMPHTFGPKTAVTIPASLLKPCTVVLFLLWKLPQPNTYIRFLLKF